MMHSYLYLSIILFCLGIVGIVARRNVFTVFMSVELMLNAANLVFIAFSRMHESMEGHVLAMMVMAVAAAEAALALAVVILLHKHRSKLDTNVFSLLKG
ncbi:NADH-quinone oxidoreductase subunit NuoK [Desulfobulbus oligotrophicus]|uniref:NADH-quinone oxidoreductase subunit K n=1 Tax=Desulfobulbus oligotrophicus TaxID=1909699 RepID=A0A7T5VEZ7_9BACT|nr:NADH-quinone oxidoreductase subunit NuoK [Desulfobulbus oligotrophicus]MDY0389804.1 NADH-quinone oxidoreductase subunit NuoK [Desulfobulbus oligotrophicus]QQG66557.1 NADH-quinone oxidoreductase subunit NuoK [Desulfobulbus oligotrophicus]